MRETGGVELASTITLLLQANQLTKCASHPKSKFFKKCLETENYQLKCGDYFHFISAERECRELTN